MKGLAVACGAGFQGRLVNHGEHFRGDEPSEPEAQVRICLDVGLGLVHGAQGRWPGVLCAILALSKDVLCSFAIIGAVHDGVGALSAHAAQSGRDISVVVRIAFGQ